MSAIVSSTKPLSRPRLGSRAVSEMQPLTTAAISHATGKTDIRDLGRGTHTNSGGVRVVSGCRTALGGTAPTSPFLPLPPAPNAQQLERQFNSDSSSSSSSNDQNTTMSDFQCYMTCPKKPRDSVMNSRRPSTSSAEEELTDVVKTIRETQSQRSHSTAAAAPHMIRSYSMPVATQLDYEVQREAMMRRSDWQSNFVNEGEVMDASSSSTRSSSTKKGKTWHGQAASDSNAMITSSSSMGQQHYYNNALHLKNYVAATPLPGSSHHHHQSQHSPSHHRQHHHQQPSSLAPSPRLTISNKLDNYRIAPRTTYPRSPLKSIAINAAAANAFSTTADLDLSSGGSDEAEAITPRAISPMRDYFASQDYCGDNNSKKLDRRESEDIVADLAFFVHPDHLRPPPPPAQGLSL